MPDKRDIKIKVIPLNKKKNKKINKNPNPQSPKHPLLMPVTS